MRQEQQEQWLRQHPQALRELTDGTLAHVPLSPPASPASLIVRGEASPGMRRLDPLMRLQFSSPVRRRLPPSQLESGSAGALYAQDPPSSYLPAARAPSPPRAQRSLFAGGGGASHLEHGAGADATVQAADTDASRASSGAHAVPLKPPPGRPPPPSASPDALRSASPPSAWSPYSPAVAPPSPGVVVVMPLLPASLRAGRTAPHSLMSRPASPSKTSRPTSPSKMPRPPSPSKTAAMSAAEIPSGAAATAAATATTEAAATISTAPTAATDADTNRPTEAAAAATRSKRSKRSAARGAKVIGPVEVEAEV